MALQYIITFILITIKLTSGASFSSVYLKNGGDVIPVDYINYPGSSLAALSQISAVDPVLSQVSALVSPCTSPCVIPPAPVPALAPVATSARIVYNSPITNVPVVVAQKDDTRGYQYAYAVFDPSTGDKKTQSEKSDGKIVQGQYSFLQPDGVRREVSYTADDLKGFNAVVKNVVVDSGANKTGNASASVKSEDVKKSPSPCDDNKSAKLTEQFDAEIVPDVTNATDKSVDTTTMDTTESNPADNSVVSYSDIINCLQSKLKKADSPSSISPLTYFLVPTLNKLC